MKASISLDANILVRYLSPDETDGPVSKLFEVIRKENLTICVPAIAHFEFANALTRKGALKIIPENEVVSAIEKFFKLPILLFWKENLVKKAIALCQAGLPSLYDATYLATAMLNQIQLVTEDKELNKKARKIYPGVFTLDEWVSGLA